MSCSQKVLSSGRFSLVRAQLNIVIHSYSTSFSYSRSDSSFFAPWMTNLSNSAADMELSLPSKGIDVSSFSISSWLSPARNFLRPNLSSLAVSRPAVVLLFFSRHCENSLLQDVFFCRTMPWTLMKVLNNQFSSLQTSTASCSCLKLKRVVDFYCLRSFCWSCMFVLSVPLLPTQQMNSNTFSSSSSANSRPIMTHSWIKSCLNTNLLLKD